MWAIIPLTPEVCRVVMWECCAPSALSPLHRSGQLTVTCTEGTCSDPGNLLVPGLNGSSPRPRDLDSAPVLATPSIPAWSRFPSLYLSYRKASCGSFIVCCRPLLLVFKEKTDEMSSRWMEWACRHPSAVGPDDQPAICFCEGKCEFI